MSFNSYGLHPDLLRGIKDLAFTRPTPIQAEAIPAALTGRDVLGCAATGSGKTAAFLLPTMHHLLTRPHTAKRTTRVLVLTPTRELASQIQQNLVSLATHTPLTGAVIIGGAGMGPQEHAFRSGVDFLIATPGRLLDHLKRSYANLSSLEVLILDEADRMLDMGFLPDIRRILKLLPTKRQTLFFSATMPNEIRVLVRDLLKDPVTIQMERQSAPAAGITQAVYPVPQHLKSALLCELLKSDELQSVICFTRTKHRANRLADYLKRNSLDCTVIHGNRTQAQRTAALAGFKAGRYRILVATDIAARGIDIADVSHVINFDCPHIPEDYIHRVGRTGRASATGDAFTLVSQDEERDLRAIERAIDRRLPRVTLPEFNYTQQMTEKLEVPIAERIAAIRQRKAQERAAGDRKRERTGGNSPMEHRRGPTVDGRRTDGNHPRPGGNFARPAHHDSRNAARRTDRPEKFAQGAQTEGHTAPRGAGDQPSHSSSGFGRRNSGGKNWTNQPRRDFSADRNRDNYRSGGHPAEKGYSQPGRGQGGKPQFGSSGGRPAHPRNKQSQPGNPWHKP